MSSLWKESITLATAVILLPFLITSTIIPTIRQLMRLKIPDDDRFVVSHQNNGRNKEINRGAGSGTFVLGPSSQEGLSSDISNPRVLSDMGLAIPKHTCLTVSSSSNTSIDNQSFETYLKSQNKRNIRQIVSYAQRYHSVLETGDASPLTSLQSPAMRRHAMESLISLSKYLGCYDRWQEIRRCYQLHWTSGDESVKSLERFFSPDLTLDNIYERVQLMIGKAPIQIAHIIRFACLTGLRPHEIIEAVKLINRQETLGRYYNQDRQALEHFRFPDIFLRPTKKAYISFVTPEILQLVRFEPNARMITYNIIRKRLNQVGLSVQLGLCRKLFASHLRQSAGIQPEVVDLLQGRVSTSILTRHYLVPDISLRRDVLAAVEKLREKIMIE